MVEGIIIAGLCFSVPVISTIFYKVGYRNGADSTKNAYRLENTLLRGKIERMEKGIDTEKWTRPNNPVGRKPVAAAPPAPAGRRRGSDDSGSQLMMGAAAASVMSDGGGGGE